MFLNPGEMGENSVNPDRNEERNNIVENENSDTDNDNDDLDELSREEFDALNNRIDELNSALDNIEEKNDDIYAQLLQLLKENREIRKQLQQTTEDKNKMDTEQN